MGIRASDGTPLEVKEGIVLSKDGEPLLTPAPHFRGFEGRARTRVFVFKGGGLAPLLFIPAAILLVVAGVTLFGVVAAIAILIWLGVMLKRAFFRL